jgi:inhibitor of cysteine peptidase
VGQELEVRLEGNVTTGYAWGLVVPVPDILAVVDPGTYRARPDTEGREGAGGTTTFVLRAVHLGTGALELVYGRPWERGVAAARTLRVDVDVR